MDRVDDEHMRLRRRRLGNRARLGIASLVTALSLVPFVAGAGTMQVASAAATCSGATYTVVANDSWSRIASLHGLSLSALLAVNNATTTTFIHPGQVVCLPSLTTTTTTTTSAPATSTSSPRSAGDLMIKQFPVQGPCWFTDSWGAPRSGGRQHEGVDIIAKSGQYLYAVDDGTLTKQYVATPGSLAGNGWRLTRTDGTYFFYAHLSSFAPELRVGSTVKAGQVIGFVGMSGNAGTPHLHFEAHPGGGAAVNPTSVVRAVDGCKSTVVPAQPGGVAPPQPGTTLPATTAPSTTATTVPATTVPATTVPVTTVPVTTVPVTTVPGGPSTTWKFVAPVKAFDTGGQKLVRGATRTISVTSLAGVPADATGLLVRVSARNVGGAGYLTVHSCDSGGAAGTSTLALRPGRLNATMTMVRVVSGTICVTSNAATDLRLDVVAHVAAGGVGVQPILVKRALDTRTSTPVAAGGTKSASLKSLGAPTGARAVTVTVTLVAPATAGSIGIGACGGTPWIVPFTDAPKQVFSAVVRTNDSGLCVSASAQVHVVLDITGVWTGSNPLVPVAPQRLFDSRRSGGLTAAGQTVALSLPSGVTRAQVTFTLVTGANPGALRAWNCSATVPAASVANASAQSATSVTVTLDVTGGSLCLRPTTTLDVVVDLVALG